MKTPKPRRRRRLRALTLWTLGTAALGVPAVARAQSMTLGIDTGIPLADPRPNHDLDPSGFPLTVQWQTCSLLEESRDSAMGVGIGFQRVHIQDPTSPSWSPQLSRTTIQWTYDRALLRHERWLVTAGFDAGPVFFGDDWDSGNPDAAQWFPDVAWALTPELQVILDTQWPVAIFAAARWNEYTIEDHRIYPFEDGFTVTVGVHIHPEG